MLSCGSGLQRRIFYCAFSLSQHRTDAASIPILAMTANAFKENAEKCFAAGMNAHLTKPLRPEEMVRAIARCCDKEKAQ